MNIALGICCLVVLVILDGASGLSEEQSLKEYQNESTLRAKMTKRACKRHGGKCRPIRPGSIYDGQLLTGGKYCSNKRDGCYVPAFDPTRCPNINCKKVWRPVCASDGYSLKTFDNLCFLMRAVACNPEDANMKWQHNRKCKCEIDCSDGQAPICMAKYDFETTPWNITKRTFRNVQCYAAEAACDPSLLSYFLHNQGRCDLGCPGICRSIWKPICVGTPDNRKLETFTNEQCFENEVRCKPAHYEDFEFKHNGSCICKIQKIKDHGSAILPRYYYDWDLSECLEFNYGGGLDENTNRFLTYDDCYQICAQWIANETTVQSTTAQ